MIFHKIKRKPKNHGSIQENVGAFVVVGVVFFFSKKEQNNWRSRFHHSVEGLFICIILRYNVLT